jgi:hypothetical protein
VKVLNFPFHCLDGGTNLGPGMQNFDFGGWCTSIVYYSSMVKIIDLDNGKVAEDINNFLEFQTKLGGDRRYFSIDRINSDQGSAADVWAAGILVTELFLGKNIEEKWPI